MNDDFCLSGDFLKQDEGLATPLENLIQSLVELINDLIDDGKIEQSEFVQYKLDDLRRTNLLLETYTTTCRNLLARYSL